MKVTPFASDWLGRAMHATLAATLLACWMGMARAESAQPTDEEFPESELVSGKRTSREQCEATRFAVWVVHAKGTECIRYFPSGDIDGAKAAVFFFHGDRLSSRFVEPGVYRDNKASIQLQSAENLSKVNRVPYIAVARPGAYGSSGWQLDARRLKEYLTLNAAVSAIKARHHIGSVHLGGQSGGATAVGALLTLGRDDVVCAVATSGGFNPLARAEDYALRRGRNWGGCDTNGVCDPYAVVEHVGSVVPSPQRRIFVIGDPEDANTAYRFQQEFAERLRSKGHTVELVAAQASDAEHHSLAHIANRTLGWCNAGLPTEEIVGLIRSGAYGLGDVRNKQ
jgi:pimeloyl-ACP methyl ester carboxylesterase